MIFNRCSNENEAFSGAFLVKKKLFDTVSFIDTTRIEPGSGFRLFRNSKHAFKTTNYTDFFVEHLSGSEYHQGCSRTSVSPSEVTVGERGPDGLTPGRLHL